MFCTVTTQPRCWEGITTAGDERSARVGRSAAARVTIHGDQTAGRCIVTHRAAYGIGSRGTYRC